jgi:hypothetical protein
MVPVSSAVFPLAAGVFVVPGSIVKLID